MSTTALILFAHGARAASWAAPFQRLQKLTQESSPLVRVELAFLEFMSPTLPELVEQLLADGINVATLVPVFFGQGGHVMRDLPLMIDELRLKHPQLQIKQVDAVGEDALVLQAIRDYCLRSLP
ncbi:CbiX/SirB N-terminal domain-containing protein [Undibacterium sp. LX40W]|uniref:CbiX/SirB N-terminal domain-containing protein n=1 Tax=Undibacterium nitidum TaxID=2762298 RepID=A0A923KSZ2_9BURK|nr:MULTISPECIES: CbiX/SirB N-terminal domain-containing protein [Undibacterium]MBC3880757.1 CbiX/SirB N-terminal domain-containing protein [Undibacterium nitidum]MBC3890510.1 CbiX/SirB N-terminal domain-containing protein [Undibacterium sp. LX40W]